MRHQMHLHPRHGQKGLDKPVRQRAIIKAQAIFIAAGIAAVHQQAGYVDAHPHRAGGQIGPGEGQGKGHINHLLRLAIGRQLAGRRHRQRVPRKHFCRPVAHPAGHCHIGLAAERADGLRAEHQRLAQKDRQRLGGHHIGKAFGGINVGKAVASADIQHHIQPAHIGHEAAGAAHVAARDAAQHHIGIFHRQLAMFHRRKNGEARRAARPRRRLAGQHQIAGGERTHPQVGGRHCMPGQADVNVAHEILPFVSMLRPHHGQDQTAVAIIIIWLAPPPGPRAWLPPLPCRH